MLRRFAALTAVLAVVVAACAPSAPELTDPKEILAKSALALKDVKTIQLKFDISGKVAFDPTGSGSNSQLDLAGTTASSRDHSPRATPSIPRSRSPRARSRLPRRPRARARR